MENLLKIRSIRKAKKPTFVRSDSHKKKRVGKKWRRPRGLQSKVRLQKKGYVRKVKIGWGSPKAVKGLNKNGLKEVLVTNIQELPDSPNAQEGIIIKSSTGTRKKVDIIKKAIELNIKILNVKNPGNFLKKVEESILKNKAEKTKQKEEKEKKKKEKEKKAKEKEEEKKKKEGNTDELSKKVEDEEKKKEEKKDKDKILIKKGSL